MTEINNKLPDVQIDPVLWKGHIQLTVKPEIMSLYGVSYASILNALKNRMNQNTLFQINNGTFSVPVVTGESKIVSQDILNGTVRSSSGAEIPLSSMVIETKSRDLKNIVSGAEGDYFPMNIIASARAVEQEVTSKNRGLSSLG